MYTIRFEILKKKAVAAFAFAALTQYRTALSNGSGATGSLTFDKLTRVEQDELRAFADSFNSSPGDEIALHAKEHQPFALVALRDRERGIKAIEQCDARKAGALIRDYPDIVPRGYRDRPFEAYIADTDEGPWMLAFV